MNDNKLKSYLYLCIYTTSCLIIHCEKITMMIKNVGKGISFCHQPCLAISIPPPCLLAFGPGVPMSVYLYFLLFVTKTVHTDRYLDSIYTACYYGVYLLLHTEV